MNEPAEPDGRRLPVWSRLYRGETRFDFIGRRRWWLAISVLVFILGGGLLVARGLNLGIDFEGGDVWQVPAEETSVAEARDVVAPFGLAGATIQELESDQGRQLRIASEPLPPDQVDEVTAALVEETGASPDDIDLTSIGPTWGDEVTRNAVRALVVFLGLVTVYIAFRFQTKMAIPALVALAHDVLVTVSVYALTQLEVTPATVIAFLTILGYSLYDSVVIFDKIDENVPLANLKQGLSYGDVVNLSLNQTLMRSLNTTITALLPVGSLVVVGAWVLGAATLQEFGVALFIGLLAGAYSSLFIAAPMVAWLKEREPEYSELKRRLERRGGDAEDKAALAAAASASLVREGSQPAAKPRKDRDDVVVPSRPRPRSTASSSSRSIPARPRKRSKGGR